MKKYYKIIIAVFVLSSMVYFGCEDYSKITAPTFSTGSADFSKFVSVGNSLTQGEQSSSVFETGQMYSFPNLIAQQVKTTFAQATISDPGSGGRIEVLDLNPFTTVVNDLVGVPTNLTYPAPYNNLGVKGAFLTDVLNTTNANNCYTSNFGVPNAMFDLVLRGTGATQMQLALAQEPTFATLWIGNNDILAYATRGGLFPITDPTQFATNYNTILSNFQGIGTEVVVANIPNVKLAPFFTTVGPGVGLAIQNLINGGLPVQGLVYQTSDQSNPIGLATPNDLLSLNVLVLLTGSPATAYLGDMTGAYYSVNNIPVPPGVDVSHAFGLDPQNPWPNGLILDPTEIGNVETIVSAYNGIISDAASSRGYAMVDVNAILTTLATNGIDYNGIHFTSAYVEGGFFSLDGIHPTSQGYAVTANEFIKVINQKYGATIPMVDVSTVPGSLVFTSGVSLGKYGIPKIPFGALDNIMF